MIKSYFKDLTENMNAIYRGWFKYDKNFAYVFLLKIEQIIASLKLKNFQKKDTTSCYLYI